MDNRSSLNFGKGNTGGDAGSSSWSEAKFMSTVPSFLKNDADILRMAEATRYEEERRKMLEKEMKGKMDCIADKLTTWNRRSGF